MNILPLSRRQLLKSGVYSGLAVAAGRGFWPATALASSTVAKEPWGTLEELAEGVWAVVSTPLDSDDWTTGCNGGLIAGKERILAIESFVSPTGAQWLAQRARELTGQWPTDVLITHFHGDHANGLEGYVANQIPQVWTTRTTLDLIRDEDSQRDEPPSAERSSLLETAKMIDDSKPTKLDLGGRSVMAHPRRGHTPSDITIEIEDPSIVFCGDLVWKGLFPNYRDTLATAFTRSIRKLRRKRETLYVPGHGALAKEADVDNLLTLVESVGEAARRGHAKGLPYIEAAAEYRLPATVSDWLLFNPKYFEVAFKAWYADLG